MHGYFNIKTAQMKRQMISITTLCQLLGGVSRYTIYRLRKKGKIRSYKIGGRVMFKETEVLEFIENSKEKLEVG